MQRVIILFMFIPAILFGNWGDLFEEQEDPIVKHHVNVITGKLQLNFVDHIVEGAVPLALQRSYTNEEVIKDKHSKWNFKKGWSFYPHINLYLELKDSGTYVARVIEQGGSLQKYYNRYGAKDGKHTLLLKPIVSPVQKLEVTNYRHNPANNKLVLDREKKRAILYLADGGKRVYKGHENFGKKILNGDFWSTLKGSYKGLAQEYLLHEEVSSSGQKTIYRYSKNYTVLKVSQVGPSSGKVFSTITLVRKNPTEGFMIEAKTSDNRSLEYFGKQSIKQVMSFEKPKEIIAYHQNKHVPNIYLRELKVPNKKGLQVSYYFPKNTRVKNKWRKEGWPPEAYKVHEVMEGGIKVAEFTYERGVTNLRDVDNNLTKFYYSGGALNKVEYYDNRNKRVSHQKYLWHRGNLIAKVLYNKQQWPAFAKVFEYDENKNVVKESIYGNLRGVVPGKFFLRKDGSLKGADSYSKWYKYDDKHRRIYEREENGLTYTYRYLGDTDLLVEKKTFDESTVYSTETFTYDEDLLLVSKVVDDGYIQREESYLRDPQTGMILEASNGLFTTKYTYDEHNQVIKEEQGEAVTLFSYDSHGKLQEKIHPLGGKDTYEFDSFGNIIAIKEVGTPKKYITYNDLNLPITCSMLGRESTNEYNKRGLILKETDYKGNVTRYFYDSFGRCIKKSLPVVEDFTPQFSFQYDVFGNVILEETPGGTVTKSRYTCYKKPYRIENPDGSVIHNTYYTNGELKKTTLPDGCFVEFFYDSLNRLVCKKREELEERWEFEGAQLVKYTDEAGISTCYEYDGFGRKVSEDTLGRRKEFSYDERGNLVQVKQGELIACEEFDLEGRVISKHENGFNRVSFVYDEEGRKSTAIKETNKGEATYRFFYDSEGRLVQFYDALDNLTRYVYEDFTRTEIDQVGNKTVEYFDALSRVIKKEQLSPEDRVVFTESFYYDREGNVLKRVTGERKLEVSYEYDVMGRVLSELESNTKKTSFVYDVKGRVLSKTKPDGVILHYAYDNLDRVTSLKSSDGSVNYEYIYDNLYLIEIKDHMAGKSIHRNYTEFGELAGEVGFNGFNTSWYYDTYGRVKCMYLPDGSSIAYEFEGPCMTAVARYSSTGKYRYSHTYSKFDTNMHVEEERLPFQIGSIISSRDLLERPTEMRSPFHTITQTFGKNSLVTKKTNTLTGDLAYSYDALNRLSAEGEKTYDFDELGNSKEYPVNSLNQIISTAEEEFAYDASGNLIQKGDKNYSFDALDRLVEIRLGNKRVTFTYDPFSRLVSKTVSHNRQESTKYYLYDRETEIGTISTAGGILELKVLGLGLRGDIGAAIAVEINEQTYIPLHDLQGNINALVNKYGQIVETYNPNAFGEEENKDYINPWRFSSKRSEEGLIFFGLRFYDPSLKRWITPDPSGFTDGRNLYQFVLNSPLNFLDQFGLSAEFNVEIPKYRGDLGPVPNSPSNERPVYNGNYAKANWSNSFPTRYSGTANINGIKMEMLIICHRNYTFNLTQEEYKQGYFNLFDHLPELLEGVNDKFGIVSFQNGINNSYTDWENSVNFLEEVYPKGTLIIGLYNKTEGVRKDIKRAKRERRGETTLPSLQLYGYLTTVFDMMDQSAPNGKILHNDHSEAAAILHACYVSMTNTDKGRMNKYMYIDNYGPYVTIPDHYGSDVRNFYSLKDYITGPFASKESKEYNIEWVPCISTRDEKTLYFADHAFLGSTYKTLVIRNVKQLIKEERLYVGKNR